VGTYFLDDPKKAEKFLILFSLKRFRWFKK